MPTVGKASAYCNEDLLPNIHEVVINDANKNLECDGSSDRITIDEERLSRAKWFSRGWTLQELIAPKHATFYDQNWTCCGTKRSLRSSIFYITGIDIPVLNGEVELGTVSVAERMSKASRRETTKVEDIAYSLLGLFNVNISLLHGEGEKTFTRLQKEILKKCNDMSLLVRQYQRPWVQDMSGKPPNEVHY